MTRWVVQWIIAVALAFALVFTVIQFVWEPVWVVSHSMENSLHEGDLVSVDKTVLGGRTPVTPAGIPFTSIYWKTLEISPSRLPGNGKVNRGNVVVFNTPLQKNIPLDRRKRLIKRAMGLPGDTLKIYLGKVYINGRALPKDTNFITTFKMRFKPDTAGPGLLHQHGIYHFHREKEDWLVSCSKKQALRMASLEETVRLDKILYPKPGSPDIYPQSPKFGFSVDNFGPVYIPKKGDTLRLTAGNFRLYQPLINHADSLMQALEARRDSIGKNASVNWVSNQDYFFMLGDNRHASTDSRFWGMLPKSHVVGIVDGILHDAAH